MQGLSVPRYIPRIWWGPRIRTQHSVLPRPRKIALREITALRVGPFVRIIVPCGDLPDLSTAPTKWFDTVYQHGSLIYSGGYSTVAVVYSTYPIQPALRAAKGSTPYLHILIDTLLPCELGSGSIRLRVNHYAIFNYNRI